MKSFKSYLIPSILASIFMSAYIIVDGIFIGYTLSDLGLAAINIAWPITAFLQTMGVAIGISGGIYISRLNGKGEAKRASAAKLTTVIYLFVFAVLFGGGFFVFREEILKIFQASGDTLTAANEYISIILYGAVFHVLACGLAPLLKNSGKVKYAMAASLTGTAVNFILDYLFIFTFKWGLKGAAYASVLAQVCAFFVCIIPYAKEFKGFLFDNESMHELLLGSIAPFILGYSYSIIIIVVNALLERLGGDSAVAAYTVLSYLLYVINALAQGTTDAIQPLFSYNREKKDYKKCYHMFYLCMGISLGLVLVSNLVFFILRNPLANLYGLSMDAKEVFKIGLILYLIGFIATAVSKVICSYLYSTNRKLLANVLVIVEPIVGPLVYFICSFVGKTSGVLVGFMVLQIALAIFSIALFYFSRRLDNNERNRDYQQAEGHDESDSLPQIEENPEC